MSESGRPVVVVLAGGTPPRLDRIGPGAELRHVTEDGLADALPTADVLLVWDFLSDAVPAPGPGAAARLGAHRQRGRRPAAVPRTGRRPTP